MTSKRICLGQIGSAHGIKGHVRLKPFTGEPEAFGDYGRLDDEAGTTAFKITALRPIKGGMLVVKFKGINDRNAAEALNGVKLYVDRERLPVLEDIDDFYVEDLIGMSVIDLAGTSYGTVISVDNFGAGDLLDIKVKNGPSVLVPFTRKAVPKVALGTRCITLDPAAAGLLDEGDTRDDQ